MCGSLEGCGLAGRSWGTRTKAEQLRGNLIRDLQGEQEGEGVCVSVCIGVCLCISL